MAARLTANRREQGNKGPSFGLPVPGIRHLSQSHHQSPVSSLLSPVSILHSPSSSPVLQFVSSCLWSSICLIFQLSFAHSLTENWWHLPKILMTRTQPPNHTHTHSHPPILSQERTFVAYLVGQDNAPLIELHVN